MQIIIIEILFVKKIATTHHSEKLYIMYQFGGRIDTEKQS